MTDFTGRVAAVTYDPLGSELAEDAPTGSTALVVDDAADFNEDGGSVRVGDADTGYTVLRYLSVDDESGVLTLDPTTPLPADGLAGDRVDLWDPEASEVVIEHIAHVAVEGSELADDTLEALIDHSLIPFLPEGIRDGQGEAVALEWRGSTLFVVTVLGKTPSMDGSVIDPETLPPTDPWGDEAPVDAPVVEVEPFAVGALEARWERVPNTEVYEVYASLTEGFTASEATLVGTIPGTKFQLASLNGALLPMGENASPVYFLVRAVNPNGAGPLSVEKFAIARQADADFISALFVAAMKIQAQQIEGGSITAAISMDVDGVLNIGSRMTLADPNAPDGKGGFCVWANDEHTGDPLIRIHPDGSIWRGAGEFDELTVIDSLRLIGSLSSIASGAVLNLENGVADPEAPTVSAGPLLGAFPAVPTNYIERGVAWDKEGDRWIQLLWNSSNDRAYFRKITWNSTSNTWVASSVYLMERAQWDAETTTLVYGPSVIGGALYAWCRVSNGYDFGNWQLKSWSIGSGAEGLAVDLWADGFSDASPASIYPVAGSSDDPLVENIYIHDQTSTRIYVRKNWNETSTWIARTDLPGLGDPLRFRGLRESSFDRGTNLLAVVLENGDVKHFVPVWGGQATPAPEHDYTITSGSWWLHKSTGTDTGIYSTKGDGKLTRYSSYFPTAGEKFWARTADTDPATSKTTKASEATGFAVPARRFATVTLHPAPAGITSADVWVGYGATEPATFYKRSESLDASRSMVLVNGKDTTGSTTLPAANTLGGSPAVLQSEVGGFLVQGDGYGEFPLLREATPVYGIVTPISPFTVPQDFIVRVGRLVTVQLDVRRASSNSTTFIDAAQIPEGFRPAATYPTTMLFPNSTFLIGGSSPIYYQFALARDTARLRIRMSDANANGMYLSASWITDDPYPETP